MDRVWQQHYGDNIPAEIDLQPDMTLMDMFNNACEKFADRDAFSSFGQNRTYAEIQTLARNFSAYLQNELGIQKGDRIALMTPNCMAFPVAMFGIVGAGAVQVNVNPLYTGRELRHQLQDADTETIVLFTGSTPVLAEALEGTPIKNIITLTLDDFHGGGIPSPAAENSLSVTTTLSDAIAKGAELDFKDPGLTGSDLLFLQYTGGTTGLSKGAALSHSNLVANILQIKAFLGDFISEENEIVITAIPLYHIFALAVNCLTYVSVGATNVLITNPRDIDGFISEMGKWKFTVFTGVNTLYNGLSMMPAFKELDFSALKYCLGGGTACQEAVSNRWKEITGMHITEGFGMSETSPVVSVNPLPAQSFSGTIGIPLSSTDVSIRDEDGRELASGEAGELCIKGPQVMSGYWRQDEANKSAFWSDGYFRSGDVAVISEDGYVKIVDRMKDMVIVSGFNVYPNEIEAVIAMMDEVAECACIGIPDDTTGEALKLFVVKKDEDLTTDTIVAYARKNLTAYKVPKQIEFIDEVPKSPVGKILRRELR
ncbi:AMP-binding protein [Sneathiella marina]|uniref:Long-chain-fatty-acid--CoA ligase n=1 Tax=Sneathiella marina TaxID=2950108 RepID=A0ABY4W7T5_9PROT|nr:AMP-binding protein [Sneathiella marina]USG61982.1 AMP-binding protein [Sneathiella marina]